MEYNAYPSSLIGNPAQISSTLVFSPGLTGKIVPRLKVLFNCLTTENLFTCHATALQRLKAMQANFFLSTLKDETMFTHPENLHCCLTWKSYSVDERSNLQSSH